MNEWYHEAFRALYMPIYAHRDAKEARQTVDLITRAVCLRPGQQVLDASCGAGRHAREFARHGCAVYALDLSRDLLSEARKSSAEPAPCYLRADLRSIPFGPRRFDLVANLFSSFGYFQSDEKNYAVLAEFARVCRPGGHVVLDFMNEPQVRDALRPETRRRAPGGWTVRETRRITGEPPRIEKTGLAHSASGVEIRWRESVRLFTPRELADAMRRAGLEITSTFGDYSGAPHTPASPRLILAGKLI